MGKAKLTGTSIDLIKKIKDQEKKLAGRGRADFAGVSTNSLSTGAGASAAVATGSNQSFLPLAGGQLTGKLSIRNVVSTIVSGVLNVSQSSTSNFVSNITCIGEGGSADTLDTLTTDGFSGELLWFQADITTSITLSHGTGNIWLWTGVDYVMTSGEQVMLIWDSANSRWNVIANFSTGGGGSGMQNPSIADLNMATWDITNVDNLKFDITGQELTNDTDGIDMLLPTGDDFDILINSTREFTLSATTLDIAGNNMTGIGNMTFDVAGQSLTSSSTGHLWQIPSGDTYDFYINLASNFSIDSTYVNVLNNIFRMRETSTSNTTLEMFADSPTPNDFDTLNTILFKGNDSAGSETIFGRVDAIQNDVTNGTEDGEIQIGVTGAGFQGAANLILNHTTLELHRQWSNSLGNGCEMVFHNDDGSMNDGQVVGQITMDSNDSSGNQTTYGQMIFSAEDVTNGTEDGGFELKLMKAGTLTSMLKTTISGIDYKVPSGDKHSFYVAGTKIVDVADIGINMYGKDLTFTTGGRINFYDIVGGGSLSAGSGTALPATPTAYFTVEYQGNTRYIPYYSV